MKNENGKMYHINLSKEDIEGAKYAIIAGDPGRIPKIASFLKNSKQITMNREYNSYLGEINGEKVLAISHGIGGASTSICVEELYQIGIRNIIRVGTCGGMNLDVLPGDIVIANAAIRQDGTTKEYIPIEFPAVSDIYTTCALANAAKELGYNHHVGIVQCKDSFYGQHNPERMPISYELQNKWSAWIKGGCLASEMESATLYIVSQILGIKAGCVLLSVWNQERRNKGLIEDSAFDTEKAIKVAINAISRMIGVNNE